MPLKDPGKAKEYHRKYHKEWYQKNKKEQIAKQKKRKQDRFRWIWEYKAKRGCFECDQKHAAALDFHHVNPSEKDGNIHRYVSGGQFKKVWSEIQKCIVLCANCHRVKSHLCGDTTNKEHR